MNKKLLFIPLFLVLLGFTPILCYGRPSVVVEKTPYFSFTIKGGQFPDSQGEHLPAVQLTFKSTAKEIIDIIFEAYRPPGLYPAPVVPIPVNPGDRYEEIVTGGRYPDGTPYNFVYGETVLYDLIVKYGVNSQQYSGEISIVGGHGKP